MFCGCAALPASKLSSGRLTKDSRDMVTVCAEDLPACTPFETSTNTKAKENINAKKRTAAPVREWCCIGKLDRSAVFLLILFSIPYLGKGCVLKKCVDEQNA